MQKVSRVLFLLIAAVVLVLVTFWLIGVGDNFHSANPDARQGLAGRVLFIGQVFLSILPALFAWNCVRAAWRLITARPAQIQNRDASPGIDTAIAVSDDERFALDAARSGERRRSESSSAFTALRSELNDAHRKLSRAKELVDKSGVGYAAVKILRLSWRCPESVERADWEPPSDVEVSERRNQRPGMAWTWCGRRFGIKLTEHPGHGLSSDKVYGDIIVWADDAEVLKLDVSSEVTDVHDRWAYTGVSGLKPGDWMAVFVDFCGELELLDTNDHAERERQYYKAKAAGIELPPDDHER